MSAHVDIGLSRYSLKTPVAPCWSSFYIYILRIQCNFMKKLSFKNVTLYNVFVCSSDHIYIYLYLYLPLVKMTIFIFTYKSINYKKNFKTKSNHCILTCVGDVCVVARLDLLCREDTWGVHSSIYQHHSLAAADDGLFG